MHKIKLAVFILLLGFQPVAHAESSEAVSLNNRAVRLLSAGKIDKAIGLFKFVLSQNPNYRMARENFSVALSNKGLSLIRNGDLAAGIEMLEESVKVDSTNQTTLKNLEKAKQRFAEEKSTPVEALHYAASCAKRAESAMISSLKAPAKDAVATILKDGTIASVKLTQSCGDNKLDAGLLDSIKLAGPMRDAPPEQGDESQVQITRPFEINRGGLLNNSIPAPCQKLYEEGKALFLKKDFRGSREKFEAALKVSPKPFQFVIKEHIGDTYYKQAADLKEKDSTAAADLFRQCLILESTYDLAEQQLNEILKKQSIDPKSYEDRRKLMEEYFKEKNFQLAFFEGNKALAVAPDQRCLEINNRLDEIEALMK